MIRNSAGQNLFSVAPTFLAQKKCSGNIYYMVFRFLTETIDIGDEDGEIESGTDHDSCSYGKISSAHGKFDV